VGVGSETATARISRYIESSLKTKSITQRESEKLADSLVSLTFALGGVMAVLTRDLRRAAAVFMVDYSCAIKLSTPICIKIAMYQAGKEGVLVKGGQAIEAMGEKERHCSLWPWTVVSSGSSHSVTLSGLRPWL
jgi:Cu2+-exporting ATPase